MSRIGREPKFDIDGLFRDFSVTDEEFQIESEQNAAAKVEQSVSIDDKLNDTILAKISRRVLALRYDDHR